MKKLMLVLTVALFLLGLTACGGGKYGDVKDVMTKFADAQNNFAASCENISSADEAVAALNNFATAMEGIVPKMAAMAEKYPELKDKDNQPEELKPLMGQIEESSKKMSTAMQKLAPYQQDPKVQAAQMKLFGAMAKMGGENQ